LIEETTAEQPQATQRPCARPRPPTQARVRRRREHSPCPPRSLKCKARVRRANGLHAKQCITHTFIHTFIHTYIHTFMHTYIHTYIHAYIHTYIHSCIHTFIHTFTHTYIHTYIHAYIHTYIHTFIHTYIHTYIQTYIHTFIHTYIHTRVRRANGLHAKHTLCWLALSVRRLSVRCLSVRCLSVRRLRVSECAASLLPCSPPVSALLLCAEGGTSTSRALR